MARVTQLLTAPPPGEAEVQGEAPSTLWAQGQVSCLPPHWGLVG